MYPYTGKNILLVRGCFRLPANLLLTIRANEPWHGSCFLFDIGNIQISRRWQMNFVIGGLLMCGMALFVGLMFRDSGLSVLNPDAAIIVLGGSICSLFIGFPFSKIRSSVRDIIETFRDQREREDLLIEITGLSRIYRRADIRAMERRIKDIDNDFLRFGLELLINNHSEEDIRQSMEREMAVRIVNYNTSQNILKTMARLTPAFGLVGTVIILIRMFSNLHSVDALAPLMAGALMSTLYGVVISNLFMLPLGARVTDRSVVSEILMNMTMEGILAIHNGEHPMKIEERLQGYDSIGNTDPRRADTVLSVREI
jgi:chemotaxis protein MotA